MRYKDEEEGGNKLKESLLGDSFDSTDKNIAWDPSVCSKHHRVYNSFPNKQLKMPLLAFCQLDENYVGVKSQQNPKWFSLYPSLSLSLSISLSLSLSLGESSFELKTNTRWESQVP